MSMGSEADYYIKSPRFGVALSWDAAGTIVDVDLQAIAFGDKGQVMDAAYYNNLKALGGGLTHSGDEQTGEKVGFDEMIWVTFGRLPLTVKAVVFVVAAYSGGRLRQVSRGKMHLLENGPKTEVMQCELERGDAQIEFLGIVFQNSEGRWLYRHVKEAVAKGQHFIDILEPTIGNRIRSIIPAAPKRIKASFAMDKGSVVDLPRSCDVTNLTVGLGWDAGSSGVDLDVSAVMVCTEGGNVREYNTVFFGNLTSAGITHAGDNLTGEGAGDDETIVVALDKVEAKVGQVVFCINIYSKGKTLAEVSNPYCRIYTDTGDELCRYTLSDAGKHSGLIVARMLRSPDKVRWSFQAIGEPCCGNVFKESMRDILGVARQRPQEFQLRQLSSSNLAASPVTISPLPPQPSRTCSIL